MKQYKVITEWNDGQESVREFGVEGEAKSYFANIDERDITCAYLIEYPTGYNGTESTEIARKEGKVRK